MHFRHRLQALEDVVPSPRHARAWSTTRNRYRRTRSPPRCWSGPPHSKYTSRFALCAQTDQNIVKVLDAEVRIARRRLHLEHAIVDAQHRYIEVDSDSEEDPQTAERGDGDRVGRAMASMKRRRGNEC